MKTSLQASMAIFSLIFLTSCIGKIMERTADKVETKSDSTVSPLTAPTAPEIENKTETTVLFPHEAIALDGKLGDGQSVELLSINDQSKLEQDWFKYMQLEPVENFSTIFKFDLKKAVTEVQKLTLSFNFLGYRADTKEWKFEMRDLVTGEWVTVGNNATVTPWYWSLITVSIENPERFVNLNGTIELRLNADFSESSLYKTPVYLDYLSLEVSAN